MKTHPILHQIVVHKVVVVIVVMLLVIVVVIIVVVVIVLCSAGQGRVLSIVTTVPIRVHLRGNGCRSRRYRYHNRRIVPFQPIRPSTVYNLLPQPNQPNKRKQRTHGHEAAPEHVDRDIFRREDIDRQRQQHVDRAREQKPVRSVRGQWNHAQPRDRHHAVVNPVLDRRAHRTQQAPGDVPQRKHTRHVRGVDRRKGEPVAAQLAVLLPRVAHPLHQAVLVDPLDAARADARMEERPVGLGLAAAHPADVALHRVRAITLARKSPFQHL